MKSFPKRTYGVITLAINTLSLENYIDDYDIHRDFAEVDFDCYRVRIISPMENCLQFTLYDLGDNIIKSVITDCVEDSLPIRRFILSLLGIVQLQSFEAEWDGYTIREGNS